jgi:hypothetical protein
MPTIDRIDAARVVIYLNDHRPAHVHVVQGERSAVLILHCPNGPLELRENIGFSRTEMHHILEESLSRLALFCREWERHHGPGR